MRVQVTPGASVAVARRSPSPGGPSGSRGAPGAAGAEARNSESQASEVATPIMGRRWILGV
jgi:hypothetical protein